MEINAGKQFTGLKDKLSTFLSTEKPAIGQLLQDVELSIGPANEGKFGVPSHAQYSPLAMGIGDAKAWKGDLIGVTDEIQALSKSSPDKVGMIPKYNNITNKYDYKVFKRGIGDDIQTGQLISPWNVSFFEQIAKKPLSYSYADKFCKRYPGTNPWATAMTLLMQDYVGSASIGNAGSITNNQNQDVQVTAEAMTSIIINLIASYSITIEELERSKGAKNNPFSGRMITEKEKYVDYVLRLLRDYLIYYGNSDSSTLGLLGVNAVAQWSSTYSGLTTILADAADVTKGSIIFRQLAKAVMAFLSNVDNKFNVVNIGMSPQAYNVLQSQVYSDVYNPTLAIELIEQKLSKEAKVKDGRQLTVTIYPDPLLKQSSIFNAQSYDYLILTSPSIEAGPDEEQQDLIYCGEPIEEFMFPVIPGQTHTNYKKLKRFAGIFAPVPAAIQAYYGYFTS